jgi:hypothetical protein
MASKEAALILSRHMLLASCSCAAGLVLVVPLPAVTTGCGCACADAQRRGTESFVGSAELNTDDRDGMHLCKNE